MKCSDQYLRSKIAGKTDNKGADSRSDENPADYINKPIIDKFDNRNGHDQQRQTRSDECQESPFVGQKRPQKIGRIFVVIR